MVDCPIYSVQRIISGKYKLRILWDLRDGPQRYGEIRRKLLTGIPGTRIVTPRVLSSELKSLVQLELVKRTERPSTVRSVEYDLTQLGKSLIPVIATMHEWGSRHVGTGA